MQLLMVLYLVAVCSIIPLYMNKGYYELGEAKALCYIAVSLCFFALFSLGYINRTKVKENASHEEKQELMPTGTELCLYATMLSGTFSFVFSSYKKTAFLGIEGWRNGLLSLFLMVFFSLAFSRFERMPRWAIAAAMVVPAFEFLLGILNRFGVYTHSLGRAASGYLATIGNINWYAGFLSVFVPLGVGIMYAQRPFSKLFFISGIYLIPGIIALFVQGSDGALLIVVSCYALLLLYSLSDPDRMFIKKCLIQFFVLGIGMTIADILMGAFGHLYTYDSNLPVRLATMHLGIIIMAAALFLYRLVRLLEEINVTYRQVFLRRIIIVLVLVAVLVGGYFFFTNFNDGFGNGRGIIWRMCADIFMEFSPWQMMVGVGQDCLYPYAMGHPVWSGSFLNVFGTDMLTNAHCELLTVLIERGFIGAATYLGLYMSIVFELFRAKEKENAAIICALPIFSYFIYSQISFSQMVATPFVYILIGFHIAFSRDRHLRQLGNRN